MNRFEEQFLKYFDGTLGTKERAELETALTTDAELRAAFESYREVVELERELATSLVEPSSRFSKDVIAKINEPQVGRFRRFFMEFAIPRRQLVGAFGTLAVLVVIVKLASESSIPSVTELPQAMRSERGPSVAIPIDSTEVKPQPTPVEKPVSTLPGYPPPGLRAVTIPVDATSSVEGWEQPNSRVDVIWASKIRGQPGVTTIVQNAQVLSSERQVTGSSKTSQPGVLVPSTVTLLVPADDAKKIELAQRSGALSLSLRGDLDTGKSKSGSNITIDDLLGKRVADPGVPVRGTGSMTIGDEKWLITESGELTPKERNNGPYQNTKKYQVLRQAQVTMDEPFKSPVNSVGVLHPSQPYPQNTEQYRGYEENPPTFVTQEALSTFSSDVDTASYANARRFLKQGTLPPPAAVRIEEFINYFNYDYPSDGERPFTVSYEIAPAPLDNGRYLLKLGVKARDNIETRKPWNLVFLIDVSGSMQPPEKLELIKRSLHVLVQNMRSEDRIGIVTYADGSNVALEPTGIDGKERILSIVDSLSANGNTNGGAGIQTAYELARRYQRDSAVNRVILATDGDFNVGTTNFDELMQLIEAKRQSGITLTTIGVGTGNLKDTQLEQLSDRGNGNYFYLDSFNEARKVFSEELGGNMEVVAKDLKLQVEFNPVHVLQYRLIGYENRKLTRTDFGNDRVDAGEVGAGHTVTALYEVVLTNSDVAKQLESDYRYQEQKREAKLEPTSKHPNEFAYLKVRFKEPSGTDSKLIEYPLETSKIQHEISTASDDFRFAAAVSYFGHLLRQSRYKGNYTYQDVVKLAEGALGKDLQGQRREFVELVKNASPQGLE